MLKIDHSGKKLFMAAMLLPLRKLRRRVLSAHKPNAIKLRSTLSNVSAPSLFLLE